MHSSIEHADRLSVFIYVQIKVAATTLWRRERKRRQKHALDPFAWATNRKEKKSLRTYFALRYFRCVCVCDFERQTKCDRINNYIMIDWAFGVCFFFVSGGFWLGVF